MISGEDSKWLYIVESKMCLYSLYEKSDLAIFDLRGSNLVSSRLVGLGLGFIQEMKAWSGYYVNLTSKVRFIFIPEKMRKFFGKSFFSLKVDILILGILIYLPSVRRIALSLPYGALVKVGNFGGRSNPYGTLLGYAGQQLRGWNVIGYALNYDSAFTFGLTNLEPQRFECWSSAQADLIKKSFLAISSMDARFVVGGTCRFRDLRRQHHIVVRKDSLLIVSPPQPHRTLRFLKAIPSLVFETFDFIVRPYPHPKFSKSEEYSHLLRFCCERNIEVTSLPEISIDDSFNECCEKIEIERSSLTRDLTKVIGVFDFFSTVGLEALISGRNVVQVFDLETHELYSRFEHNKIAIQSGIFNLIDFSDINCEFFMQIKSMKFNKLAVDLYLENILGKKCFIS